MTTTNTQRIRIQETFDSCYTDDDIHFRRTPVGGSFLYEKKIRQILSKEKSIATITKILMATYKDDPFIQGKQWSTYAFLDVIWHDTEEAKRIQESLSSEGTTTLQVSEILDWEIFPQDKSVNLLLGTNSSITSYYVEKEEDVNYCKIVEPFFDKDNQPRLGYRDQYDQFIRINENGEEEYL
jgi:hypothetical protein